jgi:hypothetical protein
VENVAKTDGTNPAIEVPRAVTPLEENVVEPNPELDWTTPLISKLKTEDAGVRAVCGCAEPVERAASNANKVASHR